MLQLLAQGEVQQVMARFSPDLKIPTAALDMANVILNQIWLLVEGNTMLLQG